MKSCNLITFPSRKNHIKETELGLQPKAGHSKLHAMKTKPASLMQMNMSMQTRAWKAR